MEVSEKLQLFRRNLMFRRFIILFVSFVVLFVLVAIHPVQTSAQTEEKHRVYGVQWAPDSNKFYTIGEVGESPISKVFIIDPNSGRSFFFGENIGWPAWSPDSKKLAFGEVGCATIDKTQTCYSNLFVSDGNKLNKKQLTHYSGTDHVGDPLWSLDGNWIFYSFGNGAIKKINVNSGKEYWVTKGYIDDIIEWRKGRLYIFSHNRPHELAYYSMKPDGTDVRFEGEFENSVDTNFSYFPSPDKRWMVTLNETTGELTVERKSF
jgi:Tol biopolymer transport system component